MLTPAFVALILLGVLSPPHPSPQVFDVTAEDGLLCDDGSPGWISKDRPNWECTVEGCSPHHSICWDDRLTHCTDDSGADLGICTYDTQDCDSVLSCFELWFTCKGVYRCHTKTLVGCTDGSCSVDDGGLPARSY